jgi:hypothetical protein
LTEREKTWHYISEKIGGSVEDNQEKLSLFEFRKWQQYRNDKLKEVEKQDYYLARIIYLLSLKHFQGLEFQDCFIKFDGDDEQEKKEKEQLMSGCQLLVSIVTGNLATFKGKLYKNMTDDDKIQFEKETGNGN